ncbi:MAG TPA: hypothetical protein VGP07_11765 [Polyangia bacterium]|jgi:hypothetical protein
MVKVAVQVAKGASSAVHEEARRSAKRAAAALEGVVAEAAAEGYNVEITKITMAERPPVVKAASAVKAAPSWPTDLADSRWRP